MYSEAFNWLYSETVNIAQWDRFRTGKVPETGKLGYYIGVLEDEESIELVPDSVQSTSGPETTKRLFKKPQFDPNLSFAISSDH